MDENMNYSEQNAAQPSEQPSEQQPYEPQPQEKNSFVFRRSLYVVKDVKKGERFTEENVRSIRPGLGLPPKYLDVVLSKTAARDIARGEAMAWEMVE